MKRIVAAVGLACLAFAGKAHADTQCAAIDGGSPELEAVDADERLAFVRSVMHDQGSRANLWRWSWTGIGLGIAAGEYALIPLMTTSTKRYEQVFIGTASLYIPLSLTVFPIRIHDYDEILERAVVDAEASQSHTMTCLVLDHAEELLIQAAKDEASLTSTLMQVVGLVLDAGYAAIIGVAFRDGVGTIINGVGAVAIGETQMFTAPQGAVKALERYRRGDLSGKPATPRVSWMVAPLGAAPGLSLVAHF
jgi:hypothetical protein